MLSMFTCLRISIKLSLIALVLCETGCALISKDKKQVNIRRPQASISGLFVKDQLLDIPEVGLTAGEALGLALEENADRGDGKFSTLYLTITRIDEVLYFPLALVKDHIAGYVQIRPGDKLSVVQIGSSQWNNIATQLNSPKIFLTGLISDPKISTTNLKALIEAVYVGDPASWSNKLQGAATAIQLRRVIGNKVHRLVVPTKVVSDEVLVTANASDIREELDKVKLLDGDLLEFTDVNIIPEVLEGRTATNARSIFEQERLRRNCLSQSLGDSEQSARESISSKLEPIKRRFEATRRLFPRP